MKFSMNKTPLTASQELSDAEIATLRACGVRTWEEYCAYAHTYSGIDFAGSNLFRSKIASNVFEGIVSAKIKSRPMGCIIPDSSLTRMMATCCETFSRGGGIDPAVGDFSEDDLPHEIRLMDQMPGIRDQGERGTCTAFASVALCEFAEGCETELSPQFLYWATKERDGDPCNDGATLDTVQEALYEDGVCEESLWPYESKPLFDDDGDLDAGQGPAPDDAVDDALNHRFSCRALSSNAVRKYRKILAAGTPVVVGLTTFKSWTTNPMTHETGEGPMPYMRQDGDGRWQLLEKPSGGHAMCLVGYVDDKSWPGGGYFIVRNSWGDDWASECEEGAGHALMPYRYIALFTHSAFTLVDASPEDVGARKGGRARTSPVTSGAQKKELPPLDAIPLNLRPFARILDRETRDFRGTPLPKGSCVLSLPQPGSPVVEYKETNFGTKEYCAILAASRFPDMAWWEKDKVAEYDSVLRRKQGFCAKIDANLSVSSLRFKPFPDFKFSWTLFQLMGARRIWSSTVVADFSDRLFDALLEDAMSADFDGSVPVPMGWRRDMRATVSARIRKVSSFSVFPQVVYVVEAFATPFAVDSKTGVCQFTGPTARLVDMVMSCAVTALGGKKKGKFIFYSIGTGLPLAADMGGDRAGDCAVTVSGPLDGDRWDVRAPGYITGQTAYRDFADRLKPVTREDIVSAVKTYVDSEDRGSMSSGKVTVGEIVEHLHGDKNGKFCGFPAFRRTAVVRALLQMHGNDPGRYAVCKEVRGAQEVFVVPTAKMQKEDRAFKGRAWLANLFLAHSIHFLGLLISSAIIIGKAEMESLLKFENSFIMRVVLAAMTMCVCGIIQNWFNSIVSSVERD